MKYTDVQAEIRGHIDPHRQDFLPRFFKTGPGEYGEGDKFLGVTVPNIRTVIKSYRTLPMAELEKLISSEWHEDRMAALLILVWQYQHANEQQCREIYDFYLEHTRDINNWDLVDLSAHAIVGPYLDTRPEKMKVLTRLAKSNMLWERRIAMLATYHYIRAGRADEALEIIDILLQDTHDLIHKATGWMLREIGGRVDEEILTIYLDQHASEMPRTMLRYAIEHLSPERRRHYMSR